MTWRRQVPPGRTASHGCGAPRCAGGVGGGASGLIRERSENLNSAAKFELFGLFGMACLEICIWHLGFLGSMFLFTTELT